jgi:hypothetical protein
MAHSDLELTPFFAKRVSGHFSRAENESIGNRIHQITRRGRAWANIIGARRSRRFTFTGKQISVSWRLAQLGQRQEEKARGIAAIQAESELEAIALHFAAGDACDHLHRQTRPLARSDRSD